jgi:hypothetical protein
LLIIALEPEPITKCYIVSRVLSSSIQSLKVFYNSGVMARNIKATKDQLIAAPEFKK